MPVHIGIDNKNVCRSIGNILGGWSGPPLSLCTDGDLLACIDCMVRYRSARSVKVSKVKGHATDRCGCCSGFWSASATGGGS